MIVDHPLLASLDAANRARLLGAATRHSYPRGATILGEGDPATGLHLLMVGRVSVSATTPDGDLTTFAVLGSGDVFGELALLTPGAGRSGTVTALEPVRTVQLPGRHLTAMRRAHPEIDDLLLGLLATRIRRLSDRLVEALHVPSDRRVLLRLHELCALYRHAGTRAVTVPLPQAELAALAGTTRQTVNQVLRRLELQGTVELARASVTVANPDLLLTVTN